MSIYIEAQRIKMEAEALNERIGYEYFKVDINEIIEALRAKGDRDPDIGFKNEFARREREQEAQAFLSDPY